MTRLGLKRALATLLLGMTALARAADPADELARVLAQPVYGSGRIASASKVDQDTLDAPSMVYVRTGGEIRAQGYRTLAEVLDSLPGTHSRYDRSYHYTGVRGISRPGDYSSRLLLLIDGVRVNEAIYDSATGGGEFPLDVGLIDRVEYLPGPGSALYGSNAVLGVVNIVTRNASQLAGLNTTLALGSGAERKLTATWGGELGPARVLLGLASQRARGNESLYFPEYDSPATHGGIARNLDGERDDKLYAKARWNDLTFSAVLSQRFKSDPTASFGAIFDTRSESTDRYAMANLVYARPFGEQHEVFARIGLANYRYDGYAVYVGDSADVPAVSVGDATWVSGELRYVWSGWQGHRILLGTEFQDNFRQALRTADLAPAPYVYTDLHLHSSRWSLFVNDEWQPVPTLRLNLGLRTDSGLDGRQTTTPRLAALWSPLADWSFKLQQGMAFREPNASENGNPGDAQMPGAGLKAESTRARELSAMWRPTQGLELSATLYALDIRDSIELVTLPDESNWYQNHGGMRSRGLELEATRVFANGAQARASWSRQRAVDADTGARLSDSPPSLLKLMLTAPGPWAETWIGANLVRVGPRGTLSGARLDPYLQLNAQLTYAPAGRHWSFGLGAYNLTGQRHADPASQDFLQDSLQQDGRLWRAQASWVY